VANTYEPIATTTLGSNSNTVTFSSISGSYTDLVLIMNFSLTANDEVRIRFNSDTSTNYSRVYFEGNGSTTGTNVQGSVGNIQILGRSTRMTNIVNIMNYSNTTTYKPILARFSSSIVGAEVGLWRSTNAITNISVYTDTNPFVSTSMFTLYGIKAA